MATLEPYYFEPNVLQARKMIALKTVNWIIGWKKYSWMTSRLQVSLLTVNFELDRRTSHKHGLAAKYSFKMAASKVEFWASSEMNFFRIAGTLALG